MAQRRQLAPEGAECPRRQLRSRSRLTAENLFLLKQLALYADRRGKSRRANDATRITFRTPTGPRNCQSVSRRYEKNWRISVRTTRSFSGPSAQILLRTSVVCIVNSFAGFTTDFFGSIPSMQSPWSIVSAPSSAPCDVIAASTRSCILSLNESGETTNAGRLFEELRSVNGKETRTMSPRL